MNKSKISAGILLICPKTLRVLLGRRGLGSTYPNLWSVFGGKFEEEDITPKKTAIREFREETGFKGKIKISKLPIYENKNSLYTFYTFLGFVDDEFEPDLNRENVDFGWFKIDEINQDFIHPGFRKLLKNKGEKIKKIIQKNQNGPRN